MRDLQEGAQSPSYTADTLDKLRHAPVTPGSPSGETQLLCASMVIRSKIHASTRQDGHQRDNCQSGIPERMKIAFVLFYQD